jgi:hypothetical protein
MFGKSPMNNNDLKISSQQTSPSHELNNEQKNAGKKTQEEFLFQYIKEFQQAVANKEQYRRDEMVK